MLSKGVPGLEELSTDAAAEGDALDVLCLNVSTSTDILLGKKSFKFLTLRRTKT